MKLLWFPPLVILVMLQGISSPQFMKHFVDFNKEQGQTAEWCCDCLLLFQHCTLCCRDCLSMAGRELINISSCWRNPSLIAWQIVRSLCWFALHLTTIYKNIPMVEHKTQNTILEFIKKTMCILLWPRLKSKNFFQFPIWSLTFKSAVNSFIKC